MNKMIPKILQMRNQLPGELQTRTLNLELRSEPEGKTLVGHAAVFNQPTKMGNGTLEVILPGAFDKTLASGRNVLALYDHDTGKPLASTGAGSLQLTVDPIGLAVSITPFEASYVADMKSAMAAGVTRGMSFGFFITDAKWVGKTFEIREVDLIEVSVTCLPQYTQTDVSLRSVATKRRERELRLREIEG